MGDIQEYFVQHDVRNFYSVSISGYHIAEAGANPITPARVHAGERLHLRRVLPRARHAHRRLRAEPVVLLQQRHGPRVLGDRPRRAPHLGGGDEAPLRRERAQPEAQVPLQTSGRSLHAQEIAFNDIRTTLQALIATYDNANSLHTNAYDEAITTPTEESVRRAMAIQLVINREWGLAQEREPQPGRVHHRRADRPGRGGGAEGVRGDLRARRRAGRDGDAATSAARSRRSRIYYEHRKHDGSYPIVGVNTFRNPHGDPTPRQARARALDDRGEGVAARAARRLPRAARARGAGGARAAQGR